MTEIWKTIPGWPEYEASSHGRVRRVLPARGTRAGKILTPRHTCGYLKVSLSRNAKARTEWVHRLVALAFHGVPDDPLKEVAHGDNCGTNNVPTNLRWDTRAGNSADRVEHGTHIQGVANPGAKLNDAAVRTIRAELARGTARRVLAHRFAVGRATIDDIATRRSWRHVA
ncbi:hypothetical protein G4D42_29600 [Burkholderia pseudomallei]|uniref:NUMOD4 domain-containing protein n=1 Tax=Burkholderia pseudomallei TaxID=28450 RepID=UPI0015949DA1|nr:NUMOD4 domain-containing protein [Burkholderia pseudomallei]NVI27306.1 hypothetical protein [Burkholderia pseudomallei]